MKLYFKRGVVSGFIITILAIGGLGIYAYINIRKLIEGSVIQSRSLVMTTYAEKVLVTTVDLETGQRGYVVTGDSLFLEPYREGIRAIDENLDLLTKATEGFPDKQSKIDELKRLVNRKMQIVKDVIEARNLSFEVAQAKVKSGEGKRAMDDIRLVINEIRGMETDIYGLESASAFDRLDRIQYVFTGFLLVPAAVVVFLFYSINANLNEREEEAAKLKKANDDILTLNHELESFTYSVSHDLRAPLRSVNGYANVLMEDYGDVLDDHGKRTVETIARNGRRMGELIDDLLDFSRLGRKKLDVTLLSMNTMVNTVIEEIKETKNYSTNAKIEINELPDAKADLSMMRQVWYNLISNALKYSGKTENPAVEIGSFFKDNAVCYYVKDNGVGFNMAYVDKLFGIFQRLHKNEEFEGTGVGLALTKRIVDRHGGTIWAEGALNSGATFYFSLPT